MVTEELIVNNFAKYKKALNTYLGEETANKIIEALGGVDVVKNASFATTKDTGLAYDGSFTHVALKLTATAVNICENIIPEASRPKKASIIKVGLLSHIAKCVMLEKNTNEWEVEKRGILYSFTKREDEGALRTGERSILIAMNNGVTFTEQEYEAMRIMDKADGDDAYTKYRQSVLSLIIRQANEIIAAVSREK